MHSDTSSHDFASQVPDKNRHSRVEDDEGHFSDLRIQNQKSHMITLINQA